MDLKENQNIIQLTRHRGKQELEARPFRLRALLFPRREENALEFGEEKYS